MAHFVKRAEKVSGKFIVNGDSWLRIYVDSTYELGYVFGAFLSKGVSNLSNYRGQVSFRLTEEDCTTLYESVEEAFNVATRFRVTETGFEANIYSKPIARLLWEFGHGEARKLPEKYLVNNRKYLRGIKEGIEYFGGNIPDDRATLKTRKFSPHLFTLYKELVDQEL